MKRLIFLFVLVLMAVVVPAQDHNVTRKPKPTQPAPSKPVVKPTPKPKPAPEPKQSKPATKPTKPAPKPQPAPSKPVVKPAPTPQPKPAPASSSASLCPDGNHPHMIDLGLPSGTKWACCNVGADKPEEYGGYYAWGETEAKTTYSEDTYSHYQNGSCVDLGSDIAGTEYDVAHVKWGGSWVMPSKEQQDELRDNCAYEWTTVNGVKGGRFTSKKNGKSIFLPAAGYRNYSDLNGAGSGGDYWSSSQNPSYADYACSLRFGSSGAGTDGIGDRYGGQSVRPVVRN